jgi:anti-sigma factor RsiW
MTTTCAGTVAQLDGYLDGQLAPAARADLDMHLADCSQCRERFAREAAFETVLARSLRSAPDQVRDDASWAQALDAAMNAPERPAAPPPWWARFRHPPSPRQLRWFALVASLALLATFSMAGFGLRRALHASAPAATDQQHALPGTAR